MIISVASQKGGTGKTTTSITLATGLGRAGKRTLLIDIDSQANSSKVILPHYTQLTRDETLYRTILERHPLAIHTTPFPNVEIVPSHILLSNTDRGYLAVKATQKTTLRYSVELMDDLEEIIYQLKKSQHILLSKNEIFVLALGYIVADFRQQGSRSWLVQELVEPPQVDSTTA